MAVLTLNFWVLLQFDLAIQDIAEKLKASFAVLREPNRLTIGALLTQMHVLCRDQRPTQAIQSER